MQVRHVLLLGRRSCWNQTSGEAGMGSCLRRERMELERFSCADSSVHRVVSVEWQRLWPIQKTVDSLPFNPMMTTE